MAEFIIDIDGVIERRSYEGRRFLIGRDQGCEIVLDSPSVSRNHAEIYEADGKWVVEDKGSGNGTFVDGEKIRKRSLDRGTEIRLGSAVLTFLGGSNAAGEESENSSELGEVGPVLDGLECTDRLGKNALAAQFVYRHPDGTRRVGHVIRDSWFEEPGFENWLQESVKTWQEKKTASMADVELRRGESGEQVLLETWARGGSLLDYIRREKRLDQKEAYELAVRVAEQVAEYHDQGGRLPSLRASRILLDEKGLPSLGFSPLPRENLAATPEGFADDLAGLAPEFIQLDGVPGKRSDHYALGALLHHMLIGAAPADGKSFANVDRNIGRGLIREPEVRRTDLVEGANDFLMSLLAKDPEQRPESADAVRTGLRLLRDRAKEGRIAQVPVRRREGAEAVVAGPGRSQEGGEEGREARERPKGLRTAKGKARSFAITIVIMVVLNSILYLLFQAAFGNMFDDPDESSESTWNQQVPDEEPAPTFESRLDGLMSSDQFDAARSLVMRAKADGEITEADASKQQARILDRQEYRVLDLRDAIEDAVSEKDGAAARRALQQLKRIVGGADAEYRRLRELVESP